MWDEDLPEEGQALPERPRPGAAARVLRAVLLWAPIAACIACLAAAYFSLPRERAPGLPVTGDGLPPPAPTLTPGTPPAAPQPTQRPDEPDSPRPTSYKFEAIRRLEDCTLSFHSFFMIEQVAIHNPGLIDNEAWREEATGAMLAFEEDCALLRALPPAPAAYDEADRWLKLAAGEADSTSTRFRAMLSDNDHSQVFEIADHMLRFIEYTSNAERIFQLLEERKEI